MAAEPDRDPDVVEAALGDEREVLWFDDASPVPFVRSVQSIAEVDAPREVSGGGRRNAGDERLRIGPPGRAPRASDRAENDAKARTSEGRTPMTVATAHFRLPYTARQRGVFASCGRNFFRCRQRSGVPSESETRVRGIETDMSR